MHNAKIDQQMHDPRKLNAKRLFVLTSKLKAIAPIASITNGRLEPMEINNNLSKLGVFTTLGKVLNRAK
ncbi:hypothetical protein A3758_19460 [Oleiphilus sp. HI0118]|nr:hypothetical protein A3758_19460 [Oleiphilus sp. HI0118]